MSCDYSEKTFQFLFSFLNEGIVKISHELLFWKWWDNQTFVMFIFLQLSLKPLKVTESSTNDIHSGRIVTREASLKTSLKYLITFVSNRYCVQEFIPKYPYEIVLLSVMLTYRSSYQIKLIFHLTSKLQLFITRSSYEFGIGGDKLYCLLATGTI